MAGSNRDVRFDPVKSAGRRGTERSALQARRLGIDASSHDVRHHAASPLIVTGCSPRAVASFLGHANAIETLNTYSHLWPTDEGRIAVAIDASCGEDVYEMCMDEVSEAR